MPLYHQIIVASHHKTPHMLADVFRRYARTVLGKGGVVRSIENHGIRSLPERAKRKFITTDGDRHFWHARYISTVFDAPTESLVEINRFLRNEEAVIRQFTTRLQSNVELSRCKTYRNPYLSPEPKVN
eukprot:gene28333-34209_t